MAAVDKLYGNAREYNELWVFVYNNKPEYLNYFYSQFYKDPDYPQAISLFPEEADRWLLKECPLEWVKEQIKTQYDLDNPHDYMAFMGIENE